MKKMKTLLVLVVFGMGLLVSSNAGAQTKAEPMKSTAEKEGPGQSPEKIKERAERDTKGLTSLLDLKGEQIEKAKQALVRHYSTNSGKGGIYTRPDSPEREKAANEEVKKFNEEMKSFLSKEQFKKFENWHEPKADLK